MNFIPQNFKRSIVLIGINKENPTWLGTGFLVRKRDTKGNLQIYLVTAKHVIATPNNYFVCLPSYKLRKYLYCNFPIDNIYFIQDNRNIDVAIVMSNSNIFNEIDVNDTIDLDSEAITIVNYLNYGGQAGDTVKMLGYPLEILPPTIMEPVCRTGCVARINAQQLQEDHTILLDMVTFNGDSGSPLFARINVANTKKTLLMGIHVSVQAKPLLSISTQQSTLVSYTHSGISSAIPTDFILETIALHEMNFPQLYKQ